MKIFVRRNLTDSSTDYSNDSDQVLETRQSPRRKTQEGSTESGNGKGNIDGKKKTRVGNIVKRLKCSPAAKDVEADMREAQIVQSQRLGIQQGWMGDQMKENAVEPRDRPDEQKKHRQQQPSMQQQTHSQHHQHQHQQQQHQHQQQQHQHQHQQQQKQAAKSHQPLADKVREQRRKLAHSPSMPRRPLGDSNADKRDQRIPDAQNNQRKAASKLQPPVKMISVDTRRDPLSKSGAPLSKKVPTKASDEYNPPNLSGKVRIIATSNKKSAHPQSQSPPPIYRSSSLKSPTETKQTANRVRWHEQVMQHEIPAAKASLVDDLSTIDGDDSSFSVLTGLSAFSNDYSEITFDGPDSNGSRFDPYNDISGSTLPKQPRTQTRKLKSDQQSSLHSRQSFDVADQNTPGTLRDPRDARQPQSTSASEDSNKPLIDGVVSDFNLMASLILSDGKQLLQCVSEAARETLTGEPSQPPTPRQRPRPRRREAKREAAK